MSVAKLGPPVSCSKPKSGDRYCVCRVPYSPSGPSMIFCDVCLDWYHGACIEVDVEKEKDVTLYTCPGCKGNDDFKYRKEWLESGSRKFRTR